MTKKTGEEIPKNSKTQLEFEPVRLNTKLIRPLKIPAPEELIQSKLPPLITEAKSVTIPGSKERVRVGTFVRIPGGPCVENSIGKIVRIEKTCVRGQSTVHVRWFYRPEDIRAGRQRFHGRMELLFSDWVEKVSCSTSSIEICRVLVLEEYISKRISSADKSTFFWRFNYEKETGICNRINEFCCSCERSYSPRHLTVQQQQAPNVPHFLCPHCYPQ